MNEGTSTYYIEDRLYRDKGKIVTEGTRKTKSTKFFSHMMFHVLESVFENRDNQDITAEDGVYTIEHGDTSYKMRKNEYTVFKVVNENESEGDREGLDNTECAYDSHCDGERQCSSKTCIDSNDLKKFSYSITEIRENSNSDFRALNLSDLPKLLNISRKKKS